MRRARPDEPAIGIGDASRVLHRALLVLIAISLVAAPSAATTYLVAPDGSGDVPTIQDAVDAAIDGDVIELADGIFTGPGKEDVATGSRSIIIRSRGGDAASCVLDVSSDGVPALRLGPDAGSGLEVRDLTIRGATFSGIRIYGGEVTVDGCVFEGNRHPDRGGAIGAFGGSTRIQSCRFVENRANQGGAVHVDGTAEIVACVFERNVAEDAASRGGGVDATGDVLVADCEFRGNVAGTGGGGLSIRFGVARDCTFVDNVVACVEFPLGWCDGGGGAVAFASILERCVFEGNESADQGGGVSIQDGSELRDSRAENNRGFRGGGIHVRESVARSSVAIGNEAEGGGGVSVSGGFRVASLEDLIVHGNRASSGGGLAISRDVEVLGCLVTGNRAGGAGGVTIQQFGTPRIEGSTIAANYTDGGGAAIVAGWNTSTEFVDTVIHGNCPGPEVSLATGYDPAFARFACCIIDRTAVSHPGESTAIFTSCTAQDPEFCQPSACEAAPTSAGDFAVTATSPALAENSRCGRDVGALGEGCEIVVPTRGVSWGRLKATYR